jgi:ribokinase
VTIQDKNSALEAAEILLKEVDTVIITLGGEGALVAREGNYHIVPGIKVNSIDGGAVGDTFRGVFCEALVEILEEKNQSLDDIGFEDLVKAAEFANYAAALCITRPGAYPSIPTRIEIEEFIECVKSRDFQ